MALSPKQIDDHLLKWRPMVTGMAYRFQKRFAATHTIDDTIAIGMAALWEAATLFDAGHEKGASFATWARHFVLHRYLGEAQALSRHKRRVAYYTTQSLDEEREGAASIAALKSLDLDPEALLLQQESTRWLEVACAKLPARLGHVIDQRITHDKTLQEIGDALGLTRERIRQIEAKALGKLRAELAR